MFSVIPAYFMYAMMMMVGIIGIVASENLIKKIICLSIMQTGILLFYISICYQSGLNPPVIRNGLESADYINPVPQVLMLTAIVVGLSITSVALAIVIKISKLYKTIYESDIIDIDNKKGDSVSFDI